MVCIFNYTYARIDSKLPLNETVAFCAGINNVSPFVTLVVIPLSVSVPAPSVTVIERKQESSMLKSALPLQLTFSTVKYSHFASTLLSLVSSITDGVSCDTSIAFSICYSLGFPSAPLRS